MDFSSSDSSLDESIPDDAWEMELEIALLENAPYSKVLSICKLRPVPPRLRRDLWRLCLNTKSVSFGMSSFSEIFDLSGQDDLHLACETAAEAVLSYFSNLDDFADALPSGLQLASDFESILTHFSQSYAIPVAPDNGWVEIVSTLFRVLHPIDRDELYASFTTVCNRFVASETRGSQLACSTFRLLLQYHDPELCSFLDSHKIGPEHFAKQWLNSIFAAGALSTGALFAMWDIFFQTGEPQFCIFFSLVLLINAKDSLMQRVKPEVAEEALEEAFSLGGDDDAEANGDDVQPIECEGVKPKTRDDLLEELRDLPRPMQSSDLVPLVDIARAYACSTPSTFRTHYVPTLFGSGEPEDNAARLISAALSLVVSAEEVINGPSSLSPPLTNDLEGAGEAGVQFLLVDCRPADQYNAGHLATAFYLDTELMLTNPQQFSTSVQALLQTQQRGIATGSKAVGEHIVFMGSGRSAEDRVANMVIAHFLRLNTPYVSMLDGGYVALHETLGTLELDSRLVSHEADLCFVCATARGHHALQMARENQPPPSRIVGNAPRSAAIPPAPSSQASGLFSKFSKLIRKHPLPPSSEQQLQQKTALPTAHPIVPPQPHLAPTKTTASYRNTAAVFSLDDNDDEDDEEFALKATFVPAVASSPYLRSATANQEVVTSLEHCVPGQLTDFSKCGSLPEVLTSFTCSLITPTGALASRAVLLLIEKSIVLIREREKQLFVSLGNLVQNAFSRRGAPAGKGDGCPASESEKPRNGVVEVSVPLTTLTKITSNRRIPEVVTFHFIRTNDDLVTETYQSLRLHIPKAGDAAKSIKLAVFKANGMIGPA